MKYRLIVANQTFEIGELLEDQPFRLFTYEHLGIRSEQDWKNLFQVHLYQDSIHLKKNDKGNFISIHLEGEMILSLTPSDVLSYAARGYQVLKKDDSILLFRPPTGKIVNDLGQEYASGEMLSVFHHKQGFVLVPHA